MSAMTLRCPRCGIADTVRMWTPDPDDADFSVCTCQGTAWTDAELCDLMELARETKRNEDGPSDSDLQQFYGAGGESPSYRADLKNAGRGHLL